MQISRGVPPYHGLLRHNRSALVMVVALFLSGCATFSPDAGMSTVAAITDSTIRKDVVAIRSSADAHIADNTVKRLLRQTLNVDTAVQVALLNNRTLQAT